MTPEERAREVCDGDWDDDPSLCPLIVKAIRAAVAEERESGDARAKEQLQNHGAWLAQREKEMIEEAVLAEREEIVSILATMIADWGSVEGTAVEPSKAALYDAIKAIRARTT